MIWIVAFTLIFIFLGANNDVGQTYQHLSEFTGYFLLIWENSIGNINPPTYQFWMNTLKNADIEPFQKTGALTVIYIIWLMWFANQALILIVLLNFLIAVVSQSYENVMNSATQFKYAQRCELIREAAVINKTFPISDVVDYHVFVLRCNVNEEEGGDWAGFVQTIKTFIRGETSKILQKNDNSIR